MTIDQKALEALLAKEEIRELVLLYIATGLLAASIGQGRKMLYVVRDWLPFALVLLAQFAPEQDSPRGDRPGGCAARDESEVIFRTALGRTSGHQCAWDVRQVQRALHHGAPGRRTL